MSLFKPAVALFFLLASIAVAADELPSIDQMKQMQTDKKWNELLGAATRILALKGDKTKDYDRVEVLLFKAEGQLQLKQFTNASTTYESITKEKTATEDQIDTAVASSMLMKKIDGKGYKVPATKDKPSEIIDVYDSDKRKDAFKAMFDASIGDLKKDVEKNRTKPNLGALTKDAKAISGLIHLEKAANGKDQETKDLIHSVEEIAVKSIRSWIDDCEDKVKQIRTRATEAVQVTDAKNNVQSVHMRGLDGNDVQTLNNIVSQCKSAATSYKQLVEEMPEGSSLKELPNEITSLHKKAQDVMNAPYN